MDIILIIIITIITLYLLNINKFEHFVNNNSTAIVYQTHFLSNILKQNILSMINDIDNNYDFWLLYDNTKLDFDYKWVNENNIKYYLYNKQDCLKHYTEKVYKPYSGIYNSPAKPIIPIFNLKYNYNYIWCIEYDVIYKGNWIDIFNYYNNDRSEVISYINDKAQSYSWNNWTNCNICTLENRLQIFLPVIRYSRYILDKIYTHLRKGYTGHHEAFIGTVCNIYSKCKLTELNPKFIGVYKYRPIIKYDELDNLPNNKLYHPVK
jgi:hypothetical protein